MSRKPLALHVVQRGSRACALLLLLCACGSEAEVSKPNIAPVAGILAPADGAEVFEGHLVQLLGSVSDTDDPADQLTAAWSSGPSALCPEAPVAADGSSVCEVALSADQSVVSLVARDPDNATDTAYVSLLVLAPAAPAVNFVSPSASVRYESDEPVAIEAKVSDAEDALSELTLLWTDESGDSLGFSTVIASDGTVADSQTFSTGEHNLTLSVTDTDGMTGVASVTFTVGDGNLAPACAWVDPLDGDVLTPHETVTLSGSVTDEDVDEALLSAAWSSDVDGPLGNSTVNSAGETSITVGPLSIGPHTLTLAGADDQGATCESTVTLSVGAPPSVRITAPGDGEIVPEGAEVLFTATLSDEADAATDLVLTWSSNLEGRLNEEPTDVYGFSSFSLSDLGVGSHTITLSATDTHGLTGTNSVLLVVDGLPTAPAVSITPASPDEGEALLASIDVASTDPDGDPISYRYDWSVNSSPAGYTTDTVPAGSTNRGEVWTVTVTPNDGFGDGAAGNASVVIANEVPVIDGATISPDPAFEGDTLTCAAGPTSDPDGDPVTLRYSWTVNGADVGVSADTLGTEHWSRGDTVVCEILPFDNFTLGAAASASVVIQNSAPSADSVVITPDPAHADDTLSCVGGGFVDADGDTAAFLFEWRVNGVYVGNTELLSGSFVGGDEVECLATPTDGLDDGSPLVSSVIITNSPPVLAGATLSPSAPVEGDTLLCSPGTTTDADGTPSFTYTYTWEVNGSTSGSTSSALGSDSFSRGDEVRCAVTASDGTDESTVTWSPLVNVLNAAPVVASVSLSPSAAYTDDTLVVTADASDADGDSLSTRVTWYVNGTALAVTETSLDGSYFDKDDSVYVSVVSDDGTTSSRPGVSSPITIQNSVPQISGVEVTPALPEVDDTLTCTVLGYEDPDGDADQSTYAWTINGAAVGSGDTLSGPFTAGDLVICTVTPFDGEDSGTYESVVVVPGGGTPQISSIQVSPIAPTEASTLSCDVSASDPDGDTVLLGYAWYVNGTDLGLNTDTLSNSYFDRDDVVYCEATPNDGADFGTTRAATSVTIGNSVPSLTSVSLSPSTVYTDTTLTATVASADLDGDSVVLSYVWTVNGSAVASAGSTLSGSFFNRGDVVYVTVTPNDGTTAGTALSSSSAFVLNSAPSISGAEITPSSATGASTLTCAAAGFADADGDTAAYTYSWAVNGGLAGSSATLAGVFGGGDLVMCTVTPTDGVATGTSATASLTIGNSAPTATSVSITPTTATETSTLTCAATGSDPDGDAVSYGYAWAVNGSTVSGQNSNTLTGSSFSRGNSVACTVIPTDGSSSGAALTSSAVTIGNSAPVMTTVSISPSSPALSSTLTCSPSASDADGDSVSYAYSWSVAGSTLSGQTSSTLPSGNFATGQAITCTATPTDSTTAGTPMTSASVSVGNSAPTMSGVSVTPTTAYESSTLTCAATATDVDGDTVRYSYAWTVNGTTVSGATSTTLTGSSFSRGNSVACVVTPNDGLNTGAPLASTAVTISNTAPVASSVSLSPSAPTEASTLTCSATGSDADSDTVSFTYAWYVDSGEVWGETNSTLTGAYFGSGNTVYCAAIPTDGTTTGASVSSSSVTVANTAPIISSVALTPTTAYETSTFTCTPTTTDADGTTSFTYTYAWYVNSSLISRTTSTLSGTYFSKGNTVYCSATASDGAASSSVVTSNVVTVANSAPVMSSVSLSPSTVYTNDTITATPAATDGDGDTVSYTYAWYVNGSVIAPTSSTLSGASYFSRGNSVYVRATPTDGTTAGTYMQSSAVTVSNTAPTAPTVSISPTDPEARVDPIVCSISTASSDVDSDVVTYSFTWTRNGSAYTGDTDTSTTSTVPAAFTVDGDAFICTATPSDSTNTGTAATASVSVVGPLYYVGYHAQFSSTANNTGNRIYAESVTLSAAADLYTMGNIIRATNSAATKLALYSNAAGGAPGLLLAYTDAIAGTTTAGFAEADVTAAPVALSAGTYWIAWMHDNTFRGYYSTTCATVTTFYKTYSYSTGFPSAWPSGSSTLTGECHNVYLGLR